MLLRFFSVLLILCILLSSSASLTVSGEETDPEGKTSDPVYEQETAAEEITSDKTPYEEPALALYPEAIEGKAEVAGLERLTYKEDNNTLVYSNGDGTETMFIFGCDI